MHFLDIIFQQDDAPVQKSKIIGTFSQKKRVEYAGRASRQPRSESIENLLAIVKQRLRKQAVFLENLEEKVYEIWKEINADVVRNLYENECNDELLENKFELKMLYFLMFVLLSKNL